MFPLQPFRIVVALLQGRTKASKQARIVGYQAKNEAEALTHYSSGKLEWHYKFAKQRHGVSNQ